MVFGCEAKNPKKMTNPCHGAHPQILPRMSPGSGSVPGRAMQCWGVAALHPSHSQSPVLVALADVRALQRQLPCFPAEPLQCAGILMGLGGPGSPSPGAKHPPEKGCSPQWDQGWA